MRSAEKLTALHLPPFGHEHFEYDSATGEDPLGHANKKAEDILVIRFPQKNPHEEYYPHCFLDGDCASHRILFGGLGEGRLDHFERERGPILVAARNAF